MDKICAFALTEPDYGSDVTSMRTVAEPVEGGFLVTGKKRWIGNGTIADYICVWARNLADKKKRIQCFVVEKGSPGLTTTKIEGKMSLRITQNADITLDKVFVPTKNKLTYATNFEKSANSVLLSSRVGIGWASAALASGAYERCLKYCLERKQFGRPIAKFQLIQERLSRMLANCESSIAMLVHVTKKNE